jgi:O-antigen ligase
MTRFFAGTNKRLWAAQASMLLALLLVPTWLRFNGFPPFSLLYSAGFWVFWPMLAAVAAWVAAGLPGLRALWRDPLRRGWALALLALVLWAWASWTWAYTRELRPAVTPSSALPLLLTVAFALALNCAGPPSRAILAALVTGVVWNSLLAGLQTALQRSVGLTALGEFPLNPLKSGTVIVQASGVRWLRPYGLLPHPNMLAGFLTVGLLAVLVWALARRGWGFAAAAGVFVGGLWALLLTFSRAAWIGLAVGLSVLLPFAWRLFPAGRGWWSAVRVRGLLLMGVMVVAGGVFLLLYRPFLAARAGVGAESVELRSTADRAVYEQIAFDAIQQSPLLGVGIGNYAWVAARDLAKTTFDLEGQPVHHVLLGVWAELGLVGLVLVCAALTFGVEAALRALRHVPPDEAAARAALLAGVFALMVVGMFDHYPGTLLPFQALWWGLLAAAARGTDQPLTG